LGRQEPFLAGKCIIGFMMELNGIGDTVVQAEGYDVVKDLGVAGGLVFKDFMVEVYWDFNSFNHIYD
jgi:hypothetical protein